MTQVNQNDDRFLLDIDGHYAKIRHKIGQLCTRLATLDAVESTLADCGTGGVYAEFDKPADAIVQMDNRIKELTARLATLDAAEATLADCGSRGIYTDFNGPADAIMQMAARIEKLEDESMVEVEITGKETVEALWAERRLRQEAERESKQRQRQIDLMSGGENAERRLRQQAEHYTEGLRQELDGVHDALNECGVPRHYGNRTGSAASVRTRILWLNRRAERAEALAALVTKKAADLLERLANHTAAHADSFADPNSSWTLLRRAEIRAARKLAAQIREALDDDKAT